MTAWLLLAIFASLYVLLAVAAIAFHLGERHQVRRQAAAGGFDKHAESAVRLVREWPKP